MRESRRPAGPPHRATATGTVPRLDWTIFHAINGWVAPHDSLEDAVVFPAAPSVALYAIATIGLWFVGRPYRDSKWKLACASAFASAGIAMLANQALAHLWDRPRPYATHPATILLAQPSADPSFPSDHAAAAFAIAFAVLAFSRRAGLVFLVAAAWIGLSRIALGLHYPSDVIAGALVGWLAATLVTHTATSWIVRIVTLVSKISDPLLAPLWTWVSRHAERVRVLTHSRSR